MKGNIKMNEINMGNNINTTYNIEDDLKALKAAGFIFADEDNDVVNKKININIKIKEDGVERTLEEITEINNQANKIAKAFNGNTSSSIKYFQSLDNAAESVKKKWNSLIKDLQEQQKKGISFDEKSLYKTNGKQTDLLRYANAFEALNGNLHELNPNIDAFVKKMRDVMNNVSPDYDYTVEKFTKLFNALKEINELPITSIQTKAFGEIDLTKLSNGFGKVKNEIKEVMNFDAGQFLIDSSKTNSNMEETSHIVNETSNKIKESFKEQANSTTASTQQQTKDIDKVISKLHEYTEATMEAKLNSEYKGFNKDSLWDNDGFDKERVSLEEYKKILDETIKKKDELLTKITKYQNKIINGDNGNLKDDFSLSNYNNGNYQRWLDNGIKEYYEFIDRINFKQKEYDNALQDKTLNKNIQTLKYYTEELMKAKIESRKLYDYSEYDNVDFLKFNGNLDDITEYKKRLEELKQQRKKVLSTATEYQNEEIDYQKGRRQYSNSWYVEEEITKYQELTKQINFMEKELENAMNNYKSVSEGTYSKDMQFIVQALQDVRQELKLVSESFENMGKNSSFDNLTTKITEMTTALSEMIVKLDNAGDSLKNAFSGKDINLIFNNKTTTSPTALNTAYGNQVRSIISELTNEKKELDYLLKQYYEGKSGHKLSSTDAFRRLLGGTKAITNDNELFNIGNKYSTETIENTKSLAEKVDILREYIELIKTASAQKHIDISSVTSKYTMNVSEEMANASKILTGEKEISNGAKEAENSIKNLFGGNNNINTQGLAIELQGIQEALKGITDMIGKGLSVNDVINGKESTDGIKNEAQGLEAVKKSVESITEAVDNKTKAFETEASTVARIVPNEITYLNNLTNQLVRIKSVLDDISKFSGIDFSKINLEAFQKNAEKIKETVSDTNKNIENKNKKNNDPNVVVNEAGSNDEFILKRFNALKDKNSSERIELERILRERYSQYNLGEITDFKQQGRKAGSDFAESFLVSWSSGINTTIGVGSNNNGILTTSFNLMDDMKDEVGELKRELQTFNLESFYNELKNGGKVATSAFEEIDREYNDLKAKLSNTTTKAGISEWIDEFKKFKNTYNNFVPNKEIKKDYDSILVSVKNLTVAQNELNNIRKKAKNAPSTYSEELANNSKYLKEIQEQTKKEKEIRDFISNNKNDLSTKQVEELEQALINLKKAQLEEKAYFEKNNKNNNSNVSNNSNNSNRTKKANELLKEQANEFKIISKYRIQLSNLNSAGNENEIKSIEKIIALHTEYIESLNKELNKYNDVIDADKQRKTLLSQYKNANEQIDISSSKQEDKNIKNNLDKRLSAFKQIQEIMLRINKLNPNDELNKPIIKSLEQLKELYENDYKAAQKELNAHAELKAVIEQELELLQLEQEYQIKSSLAVTERTTSEAKKTQRKSNSEQNTAIQKSYNEELAILTKINNLEIQNLSAKNEDIAKNNILIQGEKAELDILREKRKEEGLINNKLEEQVKLKQQQLERNYDNQLIAELEKINVQEANQAKINQVTSKRNEIESLLKNIGDTSYGEYNKLTIKDNGSGTISYIQKIGNTSVETSLKVKNLYNLLEDLQNNRFNVFNYASSSRTKNISTDSQLAEINNINSAYKTLTKTYERFVQLTTKKNTRNIGLSSKEINELKDILRLRTKANSIINNSDKNKYNKSQKNAKANYENRKAEVDNKTNSYKNSISNEHNKEAIQNYRKLIDCSKEYFNLVAKSANKDDLSDTEKQRLKELSTAWQKAISKKEEYSAIKIKGNDKQTFNELKNIQSTFKQVTVDNFNSTYFENSEKYLSKLSRFKNIYQKDKYTTEFNQQFDELKNKIKELQGYKLDINSKESIKGIIELDEKIRSMFNNIKDNSKNTEFMSIDKTAANKKIKEIYALLNQNSAMSLDLKIDFRKLAEKYKTAINSGASQKELEKLNQELEEMQVKFQAAGKTGDSFFAKITKRATGMSASFIAMYFSMYDWIRYARYGIDIIKEYDKQLTEMNKVSNSSISTLQKFQKESFGLANQIGTTAKELQASTADFLRLGETLNQAKQSAMAANTLLQVSEFENINDATKALTAMNAAYKDLEKTQINDILNEVGNNYSISTSDLASALQKSAATLEIAGNDIYEATALVTAGNAVLQDADAVGTGLKMISLRILGTKEAKDELAELGEDVEDFVVQTKSKLADTIRNFTAVASNDYKGINILDDNNNYRSTYEILLDISKVYKEIIATDKQAGTNHAQALLEVLAGKNRSNVAASILKSPDLLESVYNSAHNSEGSAQEELDKKLESIEGHINILKNAWEELWQSDDWRKSINGILDTITAVLQKIGRLSKYKFAFKGLVSSFALTNFIKLFANLGKLALSFKGSLVTLISSFKNLNSTGGSTLRNLFNLFKLNVNSIASLAGITAGAIVSIISIVKQKKEEAIANAVSEANDYSEAEADIDSQVEKFKELREKLSENNITQEESKSIKEELYKLQKQLNEEYGTEAQNIDLVNGNLETQIENIRELNKEKANALITDNAGIAGDAVKNLNKKSNYSNSFYFDASEELPIEDLRKQADELKKFIQEYNKDISLSVVDDSEDSGSYLFTVNFNGTKENLKKDIDSFYVDINRYISDNKINLDITSFNEDLTAESNKLGKDEELKNDIALRDEYVNALIKSSPSMMKYYFDLKDAVDEYNTALANGEGIETAKKNLEELKDKKDSMVLLDKNYADAGWDVEVEKKYDDIINSVNNTLEKSNTIRNIFQNLGNETISSIKTQMSEFEAFELKEIDFDNDNAEKGEKALLNVMSTLDIAKEDVDILIDELVKLGMLKDSVVSSDEEVKLWDNTEMISQLTDLADGFDSLDKIMKDLSDKDGVFDMKLLDKKNFSESFKGFEEEYTRFINSVAKNNKELTNESQDAFNDLIQKWLTSKGVFDNISSETAQTVKDMLNSYGYNADDIIDEAVIINSLKSVQNESTQTALSIEYMNAAKENSKVSSEDLANATAEDIQALSEEKDWTEQTTCQMAYYAIQKQLANENPLTTNASITNLQNLVAMLANAGVAVERLSQLIAVLNGQSIMPEERRKNIITQINEELKGIVNKYTSTDGVGNYVGGDETNKPKSSGSKKDTWLDEYKDKFSILEDQLTQELITQKDFYKQSEDLLNKYLKDSPAHIEKYAKEIAEAEKKLHEAWNSSFNEDKTKLDNDLADGLITQFEYYNKYKELNNEYYQPSGTLSTGKTISNEQIEAVKEYADVLEKLKDSSNITSEPEFISAFEKISEVAKEAGVSVEELAEKFKELGTDTRYGKFTKQFEENNRDIRKSMRDLYKDIFSDLNSGVDKMQSAFSTIGDAVEEYAEKQTLSIDTVQALLELDPKYLSMLMDENGQLQLNQENYEKLARIKMEQVVSDMGLSIAEEILAIQTLEQAQAALEAGNANMHMAQASRTAADEAINSALKIAEARAISSGHSEIKDAAEMMAQSYENAKALLEKMDFSSYSSLSGKNDDSLGNSKAYDNLVNELKHKFAMEEINSTQYYEEMLRLAEEFYGTNSEQYRSAEEELYKFLENIDIHDWVAVKLENIEKKINKAIDNIEKYYTFERKSMAIKQSAKDIDKAIAENQKAYRIYLNKSNDIDLDDDYKKKVREGLISADALEEMDNEKVKRHIENYQEWYNKANDVLDAISELKEQQNELFEKQRDLYKEKLSNIIDKYKEMNSVLEMTASKLESITKYNEAIGKHSSLTELAKEFSVISMQLDTLVKESDVLEPSKENLLPETSKKVNEAEKKKKEEKIQAIEDLISDTDVKKSATYQKILANIQKTEQQITQYQEKGWDVKKAKQYNKLILQLQNYKDLLKAVEENANSNNIATYQKVYTAWQKLQNKIDSGKTLSKSEQKKYDQYVQQMKGIKSSGDAAIAEMKKELEKAKTETNLTKAEEIKKQIDEIGTDRDNSYTLTALKKKLQETEDALKHLEEIGYENLTNKQKKTYDKLIAQKEEYSKKQKELEENTTANTIAQYAKIYDAFMKLQKRLDKGQNLSNSDWQRYNQYKKQMEEISKQTHNELSKLQEDYDNAMNPTDRIGEIERTYEESSKGIYDTYQEQLNSIQEDLESSAEYKKIDAEIQRLEEQKKTKGLSSADEAKLQKNKELLEALKKGGNGSNAKEYVDAWNKLYTLQQKIDSGKTLKDSETDLYNSLKAKLKKWNTEKQLEIDELTQKMKDDLAELEKTYAENVTTAENEINDYYTKLYSLAKQIAEYNFYELEKQKAELESQISLYKELINIYDKFDGDKLANLLSDLDMNYFDSQKDIYKKYLESLQEEYKNTLSQMEEYNQLLGALKTGSFEESMDLFKTAMDNYNANGETEKAQNLQKVLELLNQRAIESGNWEEYADEWQNEWTEAFNKAKEDLIGISESIQDVNDSLRELEFRNIQNVISQLEHMNNIFSSLENLFTDNILYEDGKLSEYGIAKEALFVSQLENAQNKMQQYLDLYNQIEAQKDTYSSEQAYLEASREALENYYSSMSDAANMQQQLIDLVNNAQQKEVESLKKIIETRKEALQSKKDYYDYDKNLKKSQKEIDILKAQKEALSAMSDATDAATKAKIEKLNADIAEKEEALQDTKDEHTYKLQVDAIDDFLKTLEESLDDSTKSIKEILKDQKEIVESAKKLYQESGKNVNETLDKLIAMYTGSGTGLEINNPNSSNQNITDASMKIETSTANIKTNETLSALDSHTQDIATLIKNGVLVKVETPQIFKVENDAMYNMMQANMQKLNNTAQKINNNVENRNNSISLDIHYDNLMNVEGNIDKSVVTDIQKLIMESYNYTLTHLKSDLNRLR